MPRAMLTLLNMALLDGWGDIARPMLLYQPWLLPCFIFFVLFVTLGVMNVIIGMICDSVLSKARDMQMIDMAKIRRKKFELLERLHGMLKTMDSNIDGKIDAKELKKAIKEDSEVLELIGSIDLPEGFSAEELVLMLDSDGDGTLSYDNFIRSFYRLIEGGDFQQLCLLQMNINSIKHHIVEIKQHTTKLQEPLAANPHLLEGRSLDGQTASASDMATQTRQKLVESAADDSESQQSAEELGEPSEPSDDDENQEDVHDHRSHWHKGDNENHEDSHDHRSHWHQTLARLEDVTATTRQELNRCVEQVSEALFEAENIRASVMSSPSAGSEDPATCTHAQSASRSSAAHAKGHSPSVAQWKQTSTPKNISCSNTPKVTCKGGPVVERCQQTIL